MAEPDNISMLRLIEMGISPEAAKSALEESGGNLDKATSILFTDDKETTPVKNSVDQSIDDPELFTDKLQVITAIDPEAQPENAEIGKSQPKPKFHNSMIINSEENEKVSSTSSITSLNFKRTFKDSHCQDDVLPPEYESTFGDQPTNSDSTSWQIIPYESKNDSHLDSTNSFLNSDSSKQDPIVFHIPSAEERMHSTGKPRTISSSNIKAKYVAQLIMICHSIPGVRNAMSFGFKDLISDYGFAPSWWKGELIPLSNVDSETRVKVEVQRLLAFLSCSQQAYTSAGNLAHALTTYLNPGKSTNPFKTVEPSSESTAELSPLEGICKVYKDLFYSSASYENDIETFSNFSLSVSDEILNGPGTLSAAIDSLIWAEDTLDASFDKVAPIVTMTVTCDNGSTGAGIDIPEEWYPDRYTKDFKPRILEVKTQANMVKQRKDKLTELLNSMKYAEDYDTKEMFGALLDYTDLNKKPKREAVPVKEFSSKDDFLIETSNSFPIRNFSQKNLLQNNENVDEKDISHEDLSPVIKKSTQEVDDLSTLFQDNQVSTPEKIVQQDPMQVNKVSVTDDEDPVDSVQNNQSSLEKKLTNNISTQDKEITVKEDSVLGNQIQNDQSFSEKKIIQENPTQDKEALEEENSDVSDSAEDSDSPDNDFYFKYPSMDDLPHKITEEQEIASRERKKRLHTRVNQIYGVLDQSIADLSYQLDHLNEYLDELNERYVYPFPIEDDSDSEISVDDEEDELSSKSSIQDDSLVFHRYILSGVILDSRQVYFRKSAPPKQRTTTGHSKEFSESDWWSFSYVPSDNETDNGLGTHTISQVKSHEVLFAARTGGDLNGVRLIYVSEELWDENEDSDKKKSDDETSDGMINVPLEFDIQNIPGNALRAFFEADDLEYAKELMNENQTNTQEEPKDS